ncbi:hypothetical protein VP1G_02978 [Cytospora mali]|uniref:Uncharacterized protein n=1 Tax=Cytospora mali TaxID=578113 RepID=A0A194UVF0_CYTMA|nr:hypothetical protein VP1G_02978 [Valsa mali var. pyri (nom. inval.)]
MTTTSTLSTLTRTPTPVSNESFNSRYQTASEGTAGTVTEPSSPGDAGQDHAGKASYRDALDLPRELKLRCQIHLEEQYYVAALNLINSLLCDGISHTHAPTKPGLIPPPGQLGVLATLAIHPTHTSKLADSDTHDISTLSLSCLRNVLATVGPVNAHLREAFLFRGDSSPRRRKHNSPSLNVSEDDEDHILGKMANRGSVWSRGQDFWKVLGWAFNCSALYPHRWRWWKPWLEYMLDVLEADYEERRQLDIEREGQKEKYEYQNLQESLLVSYVMPKNSRMSPIKPIMSALFADGSPSSQAIYKEVFKKENKIASKNNKKRKRGRVDLDNDVFGDYDDDESTGGSEPPTPEHLRSLALVDDNSTALWTTSSLAETIPLRLRLFVLLSNATCDVPDKCMTNLPDLYEKFTERIVQLPVPAFSKFIAVHDASLPLDSLIPVIRIMMPFLLPGSAPKPAAVDPEADARECISVRILEECYLPFAYRTAENNAKLSLAIESLVRIDDFVIWSPSLQKALERGVKARNEKAMPKKSGRGKEDGEQSAREILRASGSRLLAWVEILKEDDQQQEENGSDSA